MSVIVHSLSDLARFHSLCSERVHALSVRRSSADLESKDIAVHVDAIFSDGVKRPARDVSRMVLVAEHNLSLCHLQVSNVDDASLVVYVAHVEPSTGL